MDRARGIEEKFRGAGDVVAVGAAAGVKEIVIANRVRFGIGKQRKREAGFLREVAGDIGRIDADGDGKNSRGFEFGKLLLNAS